MAQCPPLSCLHASADTNPYFETEYDCNEVELLIAV